jgi:1,4-alpha-glucan branching enzyme
MSIANPVRYDVSRLSEMDLHLFNEGTHARLYDKLGSHVMSAPDGETGTYFAVWAPDAARVAVMGDFNGWDRGSHQLQICGSSGIWEGFIPAVGHGAIYKYSITSRFGGRMLEKADPFAFRQEVPPRTGSLVWALVDAFSDTAWRSAKRRNALAQPMSIYELHIGSWRRVPGEGERPLTYRELAAELPDYVARLGFTHVELMPVMEHPFGGSWGYQLTGYFAPTSRYGDPEDFMALVDALQARGIGVILDWVPSHFPADQHGLGEFDGTHVYEHADERLGFHPDWKSLIFNYGRHEVSSFLLSNACFWLDRYKVDALRVDAVASMLYLDYSRKAGEWIPNEYGGRENLGAIKFLRRLNETVHKQFPDGLTIAEESTSWPMVSRPTYVGGLGFDMKWDMGWMHDTLKFFAHDPVHRKYHHGQLTFRAIYAFTENFVLPLSHDEVVHGKGSLLDKMPGDLWQKFANLRLLYAYMFGTPGKKLLFMGGEIAQWREWGHERSLDWHLLQEGPFHAGMRRLITDLNRLYREEPAMHEMDTNPEGFEWIDCNDAEQSVLVFFRRARSSDALVLVVCNFTPRVRPGYRVGLPRGGAWREVLSSDAQAYGGSGVSNGPAVTTELVSSHGRAHSAELTLPPLGVVFLVHDGVTSTERPLGAVHLGEGRTSFRVWAPRAELVRLAIGDGKRHVDLTPERGGYHAAIVEQAPPGTRYRYQMDEEMELPDPASRLQPEGVHGPSEVVDLGRRSETAWAGRALSSFVTYEIHVGTFTPEGTFDAAAARLDELRDLGITAIEIMPVAAFPGARNWGYDGAYPFAVQASYGGPYGLRRFVDACHARGIAVIVDVVYNHMGPEGTYLAKYGPYFAERYQTLWGGALNFDGEHSDEVRRFFIESALWLVTDLGVDALRLDAVKAVIDMSPRPFLEELGEAIHRRAAELGRVVHVIAEGDANDARLVLPSLGGGFGLDGMWSEDFHHALHALLTGERAGYYEDFGRVEDLAKVYRQGFALTGEVSRWRKRRHGRSPAGLDAKRLVVFAQNHDQAGNRPAGERLAALVSFASQKLAAAATLLAPSLPLLFMGEEYGETAPFLFFVSHGDAALVEAVRRGRAQELAGFGFAGEPVDPALEETFLRSKLGWEKRREGRHAALLAMHKELIRLRRDVPAVAACGFAEAEAVAFEEEKILLLTRRHGPTGTEAALVLAFGEEPVTLTVPLSAGRWAALFESADGRWDGPGAAWPEGIVAGGGSVRLTFAPRSAVLFAK